MARGPPGHAAQHGDEALAMLVAAGAADAGLEGDTLVVVAAAAAPVEVGVAAAGAGPLGAKESSTSSTCALSLPSFACTSWSCCGRLAVAAATGHSARATGGVHGAPGPDPRSAPALNWHGRPLSPLQDVEETVDDAEQRLLHGCPAPHLVVPGAVAGLLHFTKRRLALKTAAVETAKGTEAQASI